MPNQPKTPKTGWRIPLDLIEQVQWVAADRRETVTAVVIRALRREVREHFTRTGQQIVDDAD